MMFLSFSSSDFPDGFYSAIPTAIVATYSNGLKTNKAINFINIISSIILSNPSDPKFEAAYNVLSIWEEAIIKANSYENVDWPSAKYQQIALSDINYEYPSSNIQIDKSLYILRTIIIFGFNNYGELYQIYPIKENNFILAQPNPYSSNTLQCNLARNEDYQDISLMVWLPLYLFFFINLIFIVMASIWIYKVRKHPMMRFIRFYPSCFLLVGLFITSFSIVLDHIPPPSVAYCYFLAFYVRFGWMCTFSIYSVKAIAYGIQRKTFKVIEKHDCRNFQTLLSTQLCL